MLCLDSKNGRSKLDRRDQHGHAWLCLDSKNGRSKLGIHDPALH